MATSALPAPAIDVLNARYARGEISRDEYLRLRADLDGRPS
ncbi:MAG: SHOCT domain-containing protein [Thermoplasmata archaeon]